MVLKHFTARDVVSRCDVLQAGTEATSASVARFLDAIVARMPFPVRAIQVDGGSEFQGAFEEACRERGVLLFGAAAAFAEVERRAAGMGGAFLHENRRQSLGRRTPMEYLARRLEEAS